MPSHEADLLVTPSLQRESLTFEAALERSLLRTGIVSDSRLEEVRKDAEANDLPLADSLIASGVLAEDQVNFLVGEELGVGFVRLGTESLDSSLVRLFPGELLRTACSVPLLRDGHEIVMVMADPTNEDVLASLRAAAGEPIRPVVGDRREILAAIARCSGGGQESAPVEVPDLIVDTKALDRSGVVFIFHHLSKAHKEEASEILFEPRSDAIHVLYRVGGRLREIEKRPRSFLFALIARLRILAGLPQVSAARDGVQVGAVRTRVGEGEQIIRVAIAGTPFGESAVISLRSIEENRRTLDSWNFDAPDRDDLRQALRSRGGLVLVNSPDPAVRKDLAYALLAETEPEARSVWTLEHTIPHRIDRFRQLTETDLTGKRLEAVLALSPDVLYIEDIWAQSVALRALQASLGNVLVVAGLPYPGALQGLIHLCEIGAPRPLVATALRCALAVRVRRWLCEECRLLGTGSVQREVRARPSPKGCEACGHTGYRGDTMPYEFIQSSPALRDRIGLGLPWTEVMDGLRVEGWMSLRRREEDLVALGMVDPREVL